jgi:hypothetical protein
MAVKTKIPAAPIHGPYGNVERWLTSAGATDLLPQAAYSPVLSEQSFEPGDAELRELFPEGAWISWLGGPAAAPLPDWPRRTDGRPLAHVATINLADLNGVTDAEGKAEWPALNLREGLPTSGVLEVFHDLESFGYEPAEGQSGAWRVRWVPHPGRDLIDPPTDLDLPSEVCQMVMPLPGFTLPAAADAAAGPQDQFDRTEALELALQRAWLAQRTGSRKGTPIPFSHLYGHGHRSRTTAVEEILPNVLPLDAGDEYRLILDLESWTALEGWFGDVGDLEVWMRESDLQSQAFDRAWCLIRTD